ncbi:arginyl-tRNA synthetase [Tamaricihabitans halophyticus]|uniref:arginine--tRNA ligase n=2 Tax=Tamaricihabitans halophyticus TaxID=1262583 RepID=A0A4R2QX99_9PSEU|nr:arginyl-tRNA synthetase [Tamaricihabitans halophyticus]
MLADLVRSAGAEVLTERGLDTAALPAEIIVRRPRNPRHGDYATGMALQVAPRVGLAPLELAGALADRLAREPALDTVEVATPGFLNLRLAPAAGYGVVADILEQGTRYGGADRVELTAGDPLTRVNEVTGAPVTEQDLAALVGQDEARYALLRCPPGSVHIDEDLLRTQRPNNPCYLVRYAHARLASVSRGAQRLAIDPALGTAASDAKLTDDHTAELVRILAEWPEVCETAANRSEPHRIARYLEDLARACHAFADTCQLLPKGDEPSSEGHTARVRLCLAVKQVMANGLRLLGVSAPEWM